MRDKQGHVARRIRQPGDAVDQPKPNMSSHQLYLARLLSFEGQIVSESPRLLVATSFIGHSKTARRFASKGKSLFHRQCGQKLLTIENNLAIGPAITNKQTRPAKIVMQQHYKFS